MGGEPSVPAGSTSTTAAAAAAEVRDGHIRKEEKKAEDGAS